LNLGRGCGNGRAFIRRWLRRGFWNWSAFEEIISQRRFQIGHEFAQYFRLFCAENCGGGLSHRFKLRLCAGLHSYSGRGRFRLRLMRNRGGTEVFGKRRFQIGDKFLEDAGRLLGGRRDHGSFHYGWFGNYWWFDYGRLALQCGRFDRSGHSSWFWNSFLGYFGLFSCGNWHFWSNIGRALFDGKLGN
jgi:hypothetical protein